MDFVFKKPDREISFSKKQVISRDGEERSFGLRLGSPGRQVKAWGPHLSVAEVL